MILYSDISRQKEIIPPLADPVAGKPADHVALDVGKTLLPSLVKADSITPTSKQTNSNGL